MAEKGLIERTTDKAKAAINEAETEKNVPKFRKAVDWAMAQSIENHGTDCGICGWKPWSHNKEVLNLSDLSPANPSDDDNELFATAGITRVEDLDRHDFLAVPQAIKDKIEGDGGVGRWVRDDRLEHFKNQGATITQGAHGTNQPSSENGALRTNELTHVTMPHELAERRSRQKEARVNDQLVARAEEIEKTKDKYEKKTYDYLRKERGLDHGKAGQVAKALAGRRQREGGDGNGLRITDGR